MDLVASTYQVYFREHPSIVQVGRDVLNVWNGISIWSGDIAKGSIVPAKSLVALFLGGPYVARKPVDY